MSRSYCARAPLEAVHAAYHEAEYGFPADDEAVLFERLVLEINQAGLSWAGILGKRQGFRRAYDGFDVERVAAYGAAERARLLADAAIVRNRRKVAAAIENARRLLALRESHGGFHLWLQAHHPLPHPAWTKLFRATFVFTGPLVVEEFLLSTGYLPGAHSASCPVFARIVAARPPWLRAGLEHDERP